MSSEHFHTEPHLEGGRPVMAPEEIQMQEEEHAKRQMRKIEEEIEAIKHRFDITDVTTSEKKENHRWMDIITELDRSGDPELEETIDIYNADERLHRVADDLGKIMGEIGAELAGEGLEFEKRHPAEAQVLALVFIVTRRVKQLQLLINNMKKAE